MNPTASLTRTVSVSTKLRWNPKRIPRAALQTHTQMCLLSPWWKRPFWPVILPQHIKTHFLDVALRLTSTVSAGSRTSRRTLGCTNSDPFFNVGPTNLEFRRQVDFFYNFICATWNSIFSRSVSEGVARSSLDVGCVYKRSCTRPHLGPEILTSGIFELKSNRTGPSVKTWLFSPKTEGPLERHHPWWSFKFIYSVTIVGSHFERERSGMFGN